MYCINCGNKTDTPTCQNCNHTQGTGYHPAEQQVSSFDNPISLKHWLLNTLVLCIPFAGWIFIIIWALGVGNISESKKNYARANLIVSVAMLVLLTIFYAIFFAFLFSSIASY